MDRLPLLSDRIDETLIRVEWPDPTGKYRPGAHPDKPPPHTKRTRAALRWSEASLDVENPRAFVVAAVHSCGVIALFFTRLNPCAQQGHLLIAPGMTGMFDVIELLDFQYGSTVFHFEIGSYSHV